MNTYLPVPPAPANPAGAGVGVGAGDPELMRAVCDLLDGRPVHLTAVNLVELANLPYEPLDPAVDAGQYTAARLVLDTYLYRVAEQRRGGGMRCLAALHALAWCTAGPGR